MLDRQLKFKVCGMRNAENILQLKELTPDYIGFIFYSKSKRFAEWLDQSVLEAIPEGIKKTGVFVNANYQEILEKTEQFGLQAIQLHGNESPELCLQLRSQNLEVIKAFGLDESFDFEQLKPFESAIDFFLFDTKTEDHGGSGKVFQWEILNKYVLEKPYFLSGGLSADSLPELNKMTDRRLYALDLNSRFETEPGLKDISELRIFINEIRSH